MKSRLGVLGCLAAAMFATLAYGERPTDYVPPSVAGRVVSATILVGGLALALAVVLTGIQAAIHGPSEIARHRYRAFAAAVFVISTVGVLCSVASLSSGEDRNPEWVGSFFVAAVFPIALVSLTPTTPKPLEVFAAVALTPFVWFGAMYALSWLRFATGLRGW